MSAVFDEMMNQLIRQRLQEDNRTSGALVDATCQGGRVCITGHVDNEEQMRAAIFLVEGMTGVTEVLSQVVIRRIII